MLLLVVLLEVGVFLLSFFFCFSCITFVLQRNSYPLSPYLGVGGLIILALLVVFCLRKRRKDEFDGNFDLAGCGGTLPKIELMEDDLMPVGKYRVGVDEDDGMGGRLGAGPGTGGIITPYSFQPVPVSGTAVDDQQQKLTTDASDVQ